MSAIAAEPMLPRPFRVTGVTCETADAVSFTLTPEDGAATFAFRPGQFNMLYVHGLGEAPMSITGDPARPERLVHTTRAAGAVSRGLARLRSGAALGVRGPFGNEWPLREARGRDVVFVAGGMGLAPLRPAILEVLRRRREYGRVVVLYGARTPDDILYRRQLAAWRSAFDVEVEVTVDRAAEDWRGHVGVVTRFIPRAAFEPASAVALVCGPEPMMRFAVLELERRGLPEARIHLSLERSMKCGIGLCGHCQIGPEIVCRDGPVFRADRVARWLGIAEI